MTLRFFKCLVVVAFVHVVAAVAVFGAYHLAKDDKKGKSAKSPSDTMGYTIIDTEKKEKSYTVRHGDSYWKIAKDFNVPVNDLMRHNGHEDGHILMTNDIVKIPK